MLQYFVAVIWVTLTLSRSITTQQHLIVIDTTGVISTTENEYLSICLDPYLKHDYPGKPWSTLDFNNPRVHTLARGLSPAFLRFGGTDADWSVFFNVTSSEEQAKVWQTVAKSIPAPGFIVPFFPQDIDNLHNLATSAGGKLLYDLNIQKRYGTQWDPTNAYQLLHYIQQQGYAQHMAFELGNEPNYPQLTISGQRIAEDVLIMKKLLGSLKGFEDVVIVGPDIGVATSGQALKIAQDFAKTVLKNITALTLHQYYFFGPGANVTEFYDVNYFDKFEEVISVWRDAVWQAADEPLDVWVGETSDSYDYGSPNITNKYISGLLWLDKLGLAARNQYKLVARQDFYGGNYPLISNTMYPNPDYWLSYAFKTLVGREVLQAEVLNMPYKGRLLRVYAHCTSPRAMYPAGSITFFLVNLINGSNADIKLSPTMFGKSADLYEMLPEKGDLLSSGVELNGKLLEMVDDRTLPKLKPVEVSLNGTVSFQPHSYGFLVLKEAKAKICQM